MNLLDYMRWRGDLSLQSAPFNEVDNLVLTELSYLDWSGIVPPIGHGSITIKQACDLFFARNKYEDIPPDNFLTLHPYYDLAHLIADSQRFGNIQLQAYAYDFDPLKEKQFAALTLTLSDRTLFVAYRGTDSSIVGWKEDFNIAVMCPTPSQKEAADYLSTVLHHNWYRARVSGHSKGGNLAMYAVAMYPKKNRIITVYNNDGPGFTPEFCQSEAFQKIKPQLQMFIPQSSVVGLLMCNDADRQIVTSDARQTIMQHSPFSWQIEGNHFLRQTSNTEISQEVKATTNSWVYNISNQDKLAFFDTVYALLDEAGVKTLDDVGANLLKLAPRLIDKLKNFTPGQKELFTQMIQLFVRIYGYDIKESIPKIPTPKTERH